MKRTLLALTMVGTAMAQAVAQSVSPVPREAQWGGKAFSNSQRFSLTGADKADQDAVALLKDAALVAGEGDTGTLPLTIGEAGDKAVKAYRSRIPDEAEGYYLSITPKGVVVAGRDEAGTFYGVQTLMQLMAGKDVPTAEVRDWPTVALRGVIEGFYGNPWTHKDRLRQFAFYGRNKMNTYVYGPKDDPYHRERWREPYPTAEAQRIGELAEEARSRKVRFVWAIHPGGDIKWTEEDTEAIVRKFEGMYALGVRSFAVFFDDISGEGTKADKQADLMNQLTDRFVRKHKDVEPLYICPTQYNRAWSKGDYLSTLGKTMDPGIRIMWTGNTVVDMIDKADMEWINAQLGRKAFIWLNYPVNDYCQSRMPMGKTYGNGQDIGDMVSGFCSNPMEYAEASKLSLMSIADYTWNMEAYDAEASWRLAMRRLWPTAPEAFRFFCENNVDLGRTVHGLRREGESTEFRSLTTLDERQAYMQRMQAVAQELLADSVNQPEMVEELAPWLRTMQLMGQRGHMVCQMERDLEADDSVAFVAHYKAAQRLLRAQKAIVSRDYEGSIVRARPAVSGDVITPWLAHMTDSLTEAYLGGHAYGAEDFPINTLQEGEYLIVVDGQYLTMPQHGRRPTLTPERDMVNPQRQQWVITQDQETGAYRFTNKHTGRDMTDHMPKEMAEHCTLERIGD